MTDLLIRLATAADLPALAHIEVLAGAPFRELGMTAIADDAPPTVEDLAEYARDGRAFVVADDNDRPVAYLLIAVVDGWAHIEQVSVDPVHARRGIGRSLIERADRWAFEHGLPGLTLTTFVDVPWNGPYYRRLGFEEIPAGEVGPELQAIRAYEKAAGLDQWPRQCLRRPLHS